MDDKIVRSLAETINDDLSATFDQMKDESEEADKKREAENALREEEKEKEGEGKEEIEEEEKTEKPSDKSTEEGGPESDETKSEEKEEEEESEKKTPWEAGDLEPNSGWDKETQDGFKELPQNMQEFLLKRSHEMQADYTRKTKDVAEIKRALEPARELIDKLGVSDGEAIKNLVGAHMLLQSKPLIGIQYLMQAYDVSLESVQENWQDEETFARNVKESGKLADAESQLKSNEREQLEANIEQMKAEITEFKKDHPHYDRVEGKMKTLVKMALMSGEGKPTLESLYDKAIKLDPELVAEMANKGSDKPKSGKEVKDAKKASTRIKASEKKEDEKPGKPTTIHDELSQNWDKSANA